MKTGWFRLWLVVSAAWLAGSVFLGYQALAEVRAEKTLKLQHSDGRIARIVFSEADVRDEKAIMNEYVPLITKEPQKYLDNTVTDPYDRYVAKHSGRITRRYAGFALLPPILLLLAGWAFYWVRLGFGQSQSSAVGLPEMPSVTTAVVGQVTPVPWRIAARVWWSFCWRGSAYAIGPVLLFAFVAGVWVAYSGGTEDDAGTIGTIGGYIFGLAASLPALKRALRVHLKALSQLDKS